MSFSYSQGQNSFISNDLSNPSSRQLSIGSCFDNDSYLSQNQIQSKQVSFENELSVNLSFEQSQENNDSGEISYSAADESDYSFRLNQQLFVENNQSDVSNSIVLDNSFDSYLSKGERIGVEFNGAETIVGYELKPCAICLEDLGSTRIVKLRCDHFYHKACVEPWSQNADTCPTCRESFR